MKTIRQKKKYDDDEEGEVDVVVDDEGQVEDVVEDDDKEREDVVDEEGEEKEEEYSEKSRERGGEVLFNGQISEKDTQCQNDFNK